MKGEIRDLSTGTYWSKDESVILRLSKSDDGVMIEIADLDADVFYEFVVDEKGSATFNWGQASPNIDGENDGAERM